jgi:acyl carrier protein
VIVRTALASYLGISEDVLVDEQDLEHDLGLDGADLLLVTLLLEEAAGVQFPLALLRDMKTVGEFSLLVSGWLTVLEGDRRRAPN